MDDASDSGLIADSMLRGPQDTAPQRVIIELRPDVSADYSNADGLQLPEGPREVWQDLLLTHDSLGQGRIEPVFGQPAGQLETMPPDEAGTFFEVALPADREAAFRVGDDIVQRLRPYGDQYARVYLASPPAPLPQKECEERHYFGVGSFGMAVAPFKSAMTAKLSQTDSPWPRIVHLERVYDPQHRTLRHDELEDIQIALGQRGPAEVEYGENFVKEMAHAVSVLGILGGRGNPPHCEGMIPGSQVSFTSALVMDRLLGWQELIARQIDWVTDPITGVMEAGDILLIELQVYGRRDGACDPARTNPPESDWVEAPVELEPDIHDALLKARDRGIIVIEPAGNGGSDLSKLRSFGACEPLRGDSGAILTAACNALPPVAKAPHSRHKSSNFGDRVVCYSWGAKIRTLHAGEPAATTSFDQTSGASALVAGMAALIQKAAMDGLNRRLTPDEMRLALTTRAADNPSLVVPGQRIGVMPDLTAALQVVQKLI